MVGLLIRFVVNAIALWATAEFLPGITYTGGVGTILLIALIFGIVNALVKPLVVLLTLPATILTFGLFIFVINGLMLWLTSWIAGAAFTVDGLLTAILGGIVMGIIAMLIEAVLNALGLTDDATPRRLEA